MSNQVNRNSLESYYGGENSYRRDADLGVNDITNTIIPWTIESEDIDGLTFDGSTWTCTEAGTYAFFGTASYEGNATGTREAWIIKNAQTSDMICRINSPTNLLAQLSILPINAVLRLQKDDTISVYTYQSSGGVLLLLGKIGTPDNFSLLRIIRLK